MLFNRKNLESGNLQGICVAADSDIILKNELSIKECSADFLLLPETFYKNNIWENIQYNNQVKALKKKLRPHDIKYIICGMSVDIPEGEKFNNYRSYNIAACYSDTDIQIKAKKLLIPIDEYIPPWLPDINNINSCNFSLMPENGNSFNINDKNVLMLICYEIINSSFIAKNIKYNDHVIALISGEKFSTLTKGGFHNI